jgi:hypothetical protein
MLCGLALVQDAKEMPSINIVVQALDGRNGKPLANQRFLCRGGPADPSTSPMALPATAPVGMTMLFAALPLRLAAMHCPAGV